MRRKKEGKAKRDAALAAVAARLDRISETGSPQAALTVGALRDAIRLTRLLRYDDEDDLRAWRMLGTLHVHRYTELPPILKAEDLKAAIRAFTPCFIFGLQVPEPLLHRLAEASFNPLAEMSKRAISSADMTLSAVCAQGWRRILALTPASDPGRALGLANLGAALQALFEQSGDFAHLEQAIAATRQAAQAATAADPNRPMFRSNLSNALRMRSEQTGSLSDLRDAIAAGRQAVEETPASHPGRAGYLSNLGVALRTSFEQTGNVADLRESAEVGRLAVQALSDGTPDRATILLNLGLALQTLAEHGGGPDELDDAITIIRQAVQAADPGHPDPLCLSNLSVALQARFEQTGNVADLEEAVALGRQAVEAAPAGHPDRALLLSNLGHTTRVLFEQTGSLADLDEAIAVGRQAVETAPADHPRQPKYLSDLGASLKARFEHTGSLDDLDEAVVMGRGSVETGTAVVPGRAMYLSNFSAILGIRFERTGSLDDLDEAITHARQAVQEASAGDPDRSVYLANLGLALEARYEQTGTVADLEEAIAMVRQALQATAATHPGWARRMSNLGLVLGARFSHSGDLADLAEAITCYRRIVQATPEDHPNRATYLANLSILLQDWSIRAGDPPSLEEAILIGRQAIRTTPGDHPDRVPRMSNVAIALMVRFMSTTDIVDLDEAADLGRQAIRATAAGNPNLPTYLSNLGRILAVRFEESEAVSDLDEAIAISRQAAELTPPGHPERARRLSNLGDTLQIRLMRSQSPDYLAEAIAAYGEAAEVTAAAPSTRLRAAQAAATLAIESSPEQAAGFLDTAVRLLPQIAPRQLSRADQQNALGGFADLTSDAAAHVLSLQTPDSAARALGLLELGRTVLHGQALDTRTDLTDLSSRHPDLATRFVQLRDQLEPYHGVDLVQPADMAPATADRPNRHGAAAEFAALIDQIRALPGFGTFLLPPEPDQLTRHAGQGPIVVLNVSSYRSDAITLTPAGITAVALPELSIDALAGQTEAFEQALLTLADEPVTRSARTAAQDQLSLVLEWLWDTVAEPVLDHLGFRHPAVRGEWPRIWWAPGGQLSLLPLHAAGYHRHSRDRTVLDRVISSYTPTVRALAYARSRNTAGPPPRSLIVGMPTTPGIPGSDLPSVKDEVAMLRTRLPQPTVLSEDPADADAEADGGNPTHATVLAHLPDAGIAHFACHAASNASDPSRSLLILHDHEQAPLTVTDLARVRLDHAQLAYLSACQTSRNASADLLDEAIHLTSAFQLAGYPHVIGTLWEISDRIAVQVAGAFYTRLCTTPRGLDTSYAAQALHHTIRDLRNGGGLKATPAIWAAFLHAGA
jgi:tetratricopeptide (TPR) repeat protein